MHCLPACRSEADWLQQVASNAAAECDGQPCLLLVADRLAGWQRRCASWQKQKQRQQQPSGSEPGSSPPQPQVPPRVQQVLQRPASGRNGKPGGWCSAGAVCGFITSKPWARGNTSLSGEGTWGWGASLSLASQASCLSRCAACRLCPALPCPALPCPALPCRLPLPVLCLALPCPVCGPGWGTALSLVEAMHVMLIGASWCRVCL